MKLKNIKKIVIEDFKKEDRDVAQKIGAVLNAFMQDVYSLSENRINFDNLDQEIITFSVTVDANGEPKNLLRFSTSRINRARGGVVINYSNSDGIYPTSQPSISFQSIATNLYKINHISGLQADTKYTLTFLLFA